MIHACQDSCEVQLVLKKTTTGLTMASQAPPGRIAISQAGAEPVMCCVGCLWPQQPPCYCSFGELTCRVGNSCLHALSVTSA